MSFDNLFNSMAIVFQILTLEGWTSSVFVALMHGYSEFSFIYLIPLVFIGSFFLVNLTLAVIKSKVT